MKKEINVVGAVIMQDGLILCAQRGPHGSLPNMWEFPGGKVESGESPRQALIREVSEELKCAITVGDEVTTTTHDYDFGTVKLTTFACELTSGKPELTEHTDTKWLLPADLNELEWAPADIEAVRILEVRGNLVKP